MPLKLGVLRLDGWGSLNTTGTGHSGYVPLPGDLDDKDTYKFPFISEVAEGVTWEVLCDPGNFKDPKKIKSNMFKGVTHAVKELIRRGAGAIVANCGLFMWLHARGVIEVAVDTAMRQLGPKYTRPVVALSSLTSLASLLPPLGIGAQQQKASLPLRNLLSQKPHRECKVAIFTSNGDSCKAILNAIPQLQGLTVFTHGEKDKQGKKVMGDVLVVGLNGDPMIGLEHRADKRVGGASKNGFLAIASGAPVFYDIVQPDVQLVAKAVKKTYPSVCLAIVECTQVSEFSDTIQHAMQVPVFDPANLANGMMENFLELHRFSQLSHAERNKQILAVHDMLDLPRDRAQVDKILYPKSKGPKHALHHESQRALHKVKRLLKLKKMPAGVSWSRTKVPEAKRRKK